MRQKRKDGIDPYDDDDMRMCYVNLLLDRYRQSDEMGILTTIMSGMGEKQGKNSMSTFLLSVEDWHQTMIRMGVQSISMSDLAAIITLKGMNENHRIEFLQQENALELTLDTLDKDDDVDDEESLHSAKKDKKSLLLRVKKFVQQDKTKRLINQRLSGGSGISNNQQGTITRKEAEENLKQAQNVFMTTLDKSACWRMAKHGTCRFGDKCNFKHSGADVSKQNKNEGQGKQAECFAWRDKKACRFGDSCVFMHDKTGQEKVTVVNDKSATDNSKGNAKVTTTLFNIDDSGDSWGNSKGGERVTCSIASSVEDEPEQVLRVAAENSSDKLGWDTLASIHVAQNKSVLDEAVALKTKRSASGMGGTLPITHQGYSTKFGLQMGKD